MKRYVRMVEGRAAQVFAPIFDGDGQEVPLEQRFTADVLAQIVVEGIRPATQPPSVEERIAALQTAVQMHMDAQARALGYDDLKTAATYAEEPAVPRFQEEGRALRAWRSSVWAACYGLLGQWQAGDLVEPTAGELIAQMPGFVPPDNQGPGQEPDPAPPPETESKGNSQ